MKTLVAYSSSTGNTRKVAEAIFAGIPGEKEIMPLSEVGDAGSYDLLFLGFPTHRFGPDKRAEGAIRKHCTAGRKVALFVTHAAPEEAPEVQEWMQKFRDAASSAEIVGFFDCQGQMANGVKTMLRIFGSRKLKEGVRNDTSQGKPDESRLLKAREFGRTVAERVGGNAS